MAQDIDDIDRQELAIRYVLGDLSDEEESRLGTSYLSRETQVEEMEVAEDELIDRYIRGELSSKRSRQFDEILRNSHRLRERVEFAKILARRVASESAVSSEPEPDPESIAVPTPVAKTRKKKPVRFLSLEGFYGTTTGMAPALRFAFSASVVLMLIAITGLVLVWTRLQTESRRLALEQQQRQQREREFQDEKSRNERLQAELDQALKENEQQRNLLAERQQGQEQDQQSQTSLIPATIFLLPSMLTRSGGSQQAQTLHVPRNAPAVHVNLDVQRSDYPSYNASMADANDQLVSRAHDLKPFRHKGRKYVRLQITPHDLTDGLYSVHVDGKTPAGQPETFADYLFRIRIR